MPGGGGGGVILSQTPHMGLIAPFHTTPEGYKNMPIATLSEIMYYPRDPYQTIFHTIGNRFPVSNTPNQNVTIII